MVNKTDVGKRISRLRKNLGYSQAEFAEILDVSPQAVSKWETGLTLPAIEVLLNISWICKTSINNILEGDDYIEYDVVGIDRGLLRLNKFLVCPECKKPLKLNTQNLKTLFFECENIHRYYAIDGVVDFKTREIPG